MTTKKAAFIPTATQPHPTITITRVYATRPDTERIVKALRLVVAASSVRAEQATPCVGAHHGYSSEKVWPIE